MKKDTLNDEAESLKNRLLDLRREVLSSTTMDPARRAKLTASLRAIARLAEATAKEIVK